MRRSWWRWFIFAAGLYGALCLAGGIKLADAALRPPRRELTSADAEQFQHSMEAMHDEFEDVAITTPDQVKLQAWLVRPVNPNGDAAIVLHGVGDNRLGMTGYAEILLRNGFTVLMPDARGHGSSGGQVVTYGLLERNDIRQWVEFVKEQAHARCVYGMGESMGAAELLQSLEAGAQFCGVVAESSFSTFREIAYDRMGQPFHLGPWVGRTVLRPLVEVAFVRARWKYGLDMDHVSPEDAVAQTNVPVLLIHGESDSNIPVRHSLRMHEANPRTVLWEVPGAEHCGAVSLQPAKFEITVVKWFGGTTGMARAAASR